MNMYFSASRAVEVPPSVPQQPDIQMLAPQTGSSHTTGLVIGYLIVAALCFVVSIVLPRFL